MKKLHLFFLALTLPLWAQAKAEILLSDEAEDGTIPHNTSSPGVYTLCGQLLQRDATSLKDLPSGIYIVRSAEGRLQGKNDRKVVVRN